jgi:hydrogenase 3 maturation protease
MGTGEMTSLAFDPLAEALAPLLRRRWLLLGVGNELRGDDGFGPALARRVAAANGPALVAGPAPENLTGAIRRAAPDVLLLADAANLGAAPGTVRLLAADALALGGTSTHDPSLCMLLQFLRADLHIEVAMLAVQPQTREFGAERSAAVRAAEQRVAELLVASGPYCRQ